MEYTSYLPVGNRYATCLPRLENRPAAGILPTLTGMLAKAFWLLLILVGKKERRGFRLALRTRFKLQSVSEVASIAADSARCYFLLEIGRAHV